MIVTQFLTWLLVTFVAFTDGVYRPDNNPHVVRLSPSTQRRNKTSTETANSKWFSTIFERIGALRDISFIKSEVIYISNNILSMQQENSITREVIRQMQGILEDNRRLLHDLAKQEPSHCPPGSFLLIDMCFEVVVDPKANFEYARELCREKGGELAIPNELWLSRNPNFYLELFSATSSNFKNEEVFWIGAVGERDPILGSTFLQGLDGRNVSNLISKPDNEAWTAEAPVAMTVSTNGGFSVGFTDVYNPQAAKLGYICHYYELLYVVDESPISSERSVKNL